MKSQITKNFDLKSKLRGLADGGSPYARPEPKIGSTSPLPGGGGGGLSTDAVRAASNPPAPPPVRGDMGSLPANPLMNPGAILRQREKAAGLRDGGKPIPHGGDVKGPGGPTDDEAGMFALSDKEYVLPADTVDAVGRDKLDALREATHDFKDPSKRVGLRGMANGGIPGIEVTELYDPELRRQIRQGRVPTQGVPPVQPAAVPPVEPVPAAAAEGLGARAAAAARAVPGTAASALRSVPGAVGNLFGAGASALGGLALRGSAAAGVGIGAYDSLADNFNGKRDASQEALGVTTPLGSVGADALRTLSNVGNAATMGYAGKVGQGLSSALNGGSFMNGFTPVDGGVPGAKPAATAATSAATTPSATPVAPGYQSNRLGEMGVPASMQNSDALVNDMAPGGSNGRDILRNQGTMAPQNLGSYGGNANIYGRATDPARPGRMNDFTGVGGGAPSSGSGGGVGGAPGQDFVNGSVTASALRGLGSGPSAPGGVGSSPYAAAQAGLGSFGGGSAFFGSNGKDRFDAQLEGGRNKNVVNGSDWTQRHGLAVEQARTSDLNSQRDQSTALTNSALTNATARRNNDQTTATSMYDAGLRAQSADSALRSHMLVEQAKLNATAREKGLTQEETGTKDVRDMALGRYGKDSPDAQALLSFIQAAPKELTGGLASARPEDRSRAFEDLTKRYEQNKVTNSRQPAWGNTSSEYDPIKERRSGQFFNDVFNHKQSPIDAAQGKLRGMVGMNDNVLVTDSGRVVQEAEMPDDQAVTRITRDQIADAKRRSSLRKLNPRE